MNSKQNERPPSRTLVIGSGGRLGKDLMLAFQDDDLTGLDRTQLDLSNPSDIESRLKNVDFDRIILSASLTAVDYCEDNPEEAFQVNSKAPGLIAEIAASKDTHVTYISTDFVFDGNADSPLKEDDIAKPISVYGASKLQGEQEVLKASPKNLVARVSWLFSPSRPAFPEWIVGKAQTESELKLPADKIACPTYGPDIADAILLLLNSKTEGPAEGIFHICNRGICTWQEWGQACLDETLNQGRHLSVNTIGKNKMSDIPAFKAKRPAYSALDNTKLEDFTQQAMRSWKDALREHFSATIKSSATSSAA